MLIFIPSIVMAENFAVESNQTKVFVTVIPNNTIIVQPSDNTKIEELVQKLTEKPDWTKGDILLGSSTIFAFFAFGSFLVIRFESTKIQKQLDWMVVVLSFIGGIQILHLIVIISIMLEFFNPISYAGSIVTTIMFLIVILFAVHKIIRYENTYSTKKSNTSKVTEEFIQRIKLEQRSIRENVQRQLDDMRRERLKFDRETWY